MNNINDILDCAGVYGIQNILTGKIHYIGSSRNIKKRWKQHLTSPSSDDFHKLLYDNKDDYQCILLHKYDGVLNDRHDYHVKLVPIEFKFINLYTELGHPLATSIDNHKGKNNKKHIGPYYIPDKKKYNTGWIWITNGTNTYRIRPNEYGTKYNKDEYTRGRTMGKYKKTSMFVNI